MKAPLRKSLARFGLLVAAVSIVSTVTSAWINKHIQFLPIQVSKTAYYPPESTILLCGMGLAAMLMSSLIHQHWLMAVGTVATILLAGISHLQAPIIHSLCAAVAFASYALHIRVVLGNWRFPAVLLTMQGIAGVIALYGRYVADNSIFENFVLREQVLGLLQWVAICAIGAGLWICTGHKIPSD